MFHEGDLPNGMGIGYMSTSGIYVFPLLISLYILFPN